jgi:K+-sensing histidine kinase KdpD
MIVYANPKARLYLGLPETVEDQLETFQCQAAKEYHLEPAHVWANWPEPETAPRFLVRPANASSPAFWLQVEELWLPDDKSGGCVLCLRDVTAQIATQQDMRKFHIVVSHKLRTPLSGIVSILDFMVNASDGVPHKDLVKLARAGMDSSMRLSQEIDDILEYVNAPAVAQQGEWFVLSALPGSIRQIAAEIGIERCHVDLPPELAPVRLSLSEKAVESILWEILENARKFHPCQSPSMSVTVQSRRQAVSLEIADDGLTLSPEQLTWAWLPYIQGEKYVTGETPGMGLGLALVASLVWSAGGEVGLRNRHDGGGVIVELTLPVRGANTHD